MLINRVALISFFVFALPGHSLSQEYIPKPNGPPQETGADKSVPTEPGLPLPAAAADKSMLVVPVAPSPEADTDKSMLVVPVAPLPEADTSKSKPVVPVAPLPETDTGKSKPVVPVAPRPETAIQKKTQSAKPKPSIHVVVKAATYKAATYNVLSDESSRKNGDPAGRWESDRKDHVVQLIKKIDPDIIGLQEVEDWHCKIEGWKLNCWAKMQEFVRDELAGPSSAWSMFGEARHRVVCGWDVPCKSKVQQEYTPILYKKDRFTLKDSGHEIIKGGSATNTDWRVITFVKLEERATRTTLFAFNVHFPAPHGKKELTMRKNKMAEEFRDFVRSKTSNGSEFVIFGDFNSTVAPLKSRTGGVPLKVYDAMREIPSSDVFRQGKGDADGPGHTMNSHEKLDRRIDYIFASSAQAAANAKTWSDSFRDDKKTPSDHLPVSAEISLKAIIEE
jgi:endonuclease/exonuclease/phosphatase family metal-dependent hydrolase